MLRQRFAPPLRARRQSAAPHKLGWLPEPGFRDGPIAIATPTGRLRGESSVPDMSLLGGVDARSRDDDGGRLATRFLGGFRPRGARSAWLLAGAGGSLACGCAALGRCRRAAGPRRWGGSRAGGSVGLLLPLWVDGAGLRDLDAALWSANQMRIYGIGGPGVEAAA